MKKVFYISEFGKQPSFMIKDNNFPIEPWHGTWDNFEECKQDLLKWQKEKIEDLTIKLENEHKLFSRLEELKEEDCEEKKWVY